MLFEIIIRFRKTLQPKPPGLLTKAKDVLPLRPGVYFDQCAVLYAVRMRPKE